MRCFCPYKRISNKVLSIAEVPITTSYDGDTSEHHSVPHGVSVLANTIRYVSIKHPLQFYGIPDIVLIAAGFILGGIFLDAYLEIIEITQKQIDTLETKIAAINNKDVKNVRVYVLTHTYFTISSKRLQFLISHVRIHVIRFPNILASILISDTSTNFSVSCWLA